MLNPGSLIILNELAGSYSLQRNFDQAARVTAQIGKFGAKDPFLLTWKPQIDIDRDGNAAPMHARLDELSRRGPESARAVAFNAMFLGLFERDFEAARQSMMLLPKSEVPGLSNEIFPRAYFAGQIAKLVGKPQEAKEYFTAARVEAAALVAGQPEDAQAMVVLALVGVGLGNKEDALREARRAGDMLPVSKDAYDGSMMRMYLAMVAANVGEKDLAISELQELVKIPSSVNYGQPRLNPTWDPLRSDPRFEAIVASLAPVKK